MTDYQELRRLAEQATPGPWGDEWPQRERATLAHIIREHNDGPQVANVLLEEDAAYIAAANPAAILALLSERQENQRRIAELEEGLRRLNDAIPGTAIDLSNSSEWSELARATIQARSLLQSSAASLTELRDQGDEE